MISASDLKEGMTVKIGNELLKLITVEYRAGTAKMGSSIFCKLKNIEKNTIVEKKFHPEDKIEEVNLESQEMEFLYRDEDNFYFMHPNTYEQITISKDKIGNFEKFLKEGMKLKIEFFGDTPVDVILPKFVEVKVKSTGAGIRGETDATYKPAILENDMEILVPQFIKEGDILRIDPFTGKYLSRVEK
jgi:elongation factor P